MGGATRGKQFSEVVKMKMFMFLIRVPVAWSKPLEECTRSWLPEFRAGWGMGNFGYWTTFYSSVGGLFYFTLLYLFIFYDHGIFDGKKIKNISAVLSLSALVNFVTYCWRKSRLHRTRSVSDGCYDWTERRLQCWMNLTVSTWQWKFCY